MDPFVRWLALDPVLAAAARPLEILVERLGRSLDCESVVVARLSEAGSGRTTQLVAFWTDEGRVDRVESPVSGRPCELVLRGRPCTVSSRLQQLFPQLEFHGSAGFEAYVGQPLIRVDGVVIGHIGVAARRPFKEARRARRLLAAIAPRLAAELEQRHRTVESGATHVTGLGAAGTPSRLAERPEMLVREAHHRVKNNLQVVASVLAMQAGASKAEAVSRALQDAQARIAAVALLHAYLSENPGAALVDMRSYLRKLGSSIRKTAEGATGARVTLEFVLDEIAFPPALAMTCGLLVNELVVNAYQHAFGAMGAGIVQVRLVHTDGSVTIGVRDDGKGLPPDESGQPGGFGLRLVRLLATTQLGGQLSITRNGGTQVLVTFPDAPRRRVSSREVLSTVAGELDV